MELPTDWSDFHYMSSQPNSGSFSQNVSAYFRRPNRIVKTANRRNSPRALTRRRTTAAVHFPTRTSATNSNQHMDQYQWQCATGLMPERPISWHPPSFDYAVDSPNPPYQIHSPTTEFLGTPFNAAEFGSLVTPIMYPVANEPQIQELIVPLEELSAQEYDQQASNWPGLYSKQNPTVPIDSTQTYHPTFVLPEYQFRSNPNWQCDLRPEDFGVVDPDQEVSLFERPVLPINGTEPSFSSLTPNDDQDDLIGMGLYDSPIQVQSMSSLGAHRQNSISGTSGKGLKLEESFEPVLTNDQDDEDDQEEDQDEDEEDDEAEVQDIDVRQETPQEFYSEQPSAAYFSNEGAPSLANHSFFFEQDSLDAPVYSNVYDPKYMYYDSTNYGWCAVNNGSYGWV